MVLRVLEKSKTGASVEVPSSWKKRSELLSAFFVALSEHSPQ
jgi:hypothetical protein